MKNVIGVRFMPVGPISYYEAGQTKYKMDEKLIINNGNAVDIGQVVIVDKKSNEEGGILSHKNIIRVATEKDLEQDETIGRYRAPKSRTTCPLVPLSSGSSAQMSACHRAGAAPPRLRSSARAAR